MQDFSIDAHKFIACDMSKYIRYKEHQIQNDDFIESNFNMSLFLRSKDAWITDLSEAIDAFTSQNNNQHMLDCMERVDEIEEEVFSLTIDSEDD